jgi:hypothetical protein
MARRWHAALRERRTFSSRLRATSHCRARNEAALRAFTKEPGAPPPGGPEAPTTGGVMTKKIGTTEARQGETPHIVRYVLVISTVAAVVALAIVGVVLLS